jgi:23S rRNA (cytidine1920-2'-O)/16S rRNA (cytidine1409-2'-O)-methyltransferase
MVAKTRLDSLMVELGLTDSRSAAQRLIMAGEVRVNGQLTIKPATFVDPTAILEILRGQAYVSRGGEKLAAALDQFPIPIRGRVCADLGASTGGFTDCLLQNGAARVYAIDVGIGILHWKLRQDERVVVMEKTNARYIERLPEPIGLLTIDASFISLKVLLPVVLHWLEPAANVVALIKPQFEAGRHETAKGDGVIRNPEIHRRVLYDILAYAQEKDYTVKGLLRSPLLGPKGNVEFLAWLGLNQELPGNIEALISGIVP